MSASAVFNSDPQTTQNSCNHLLLTGENTSLMFKCAFWLFRLHWSKVLLVSTVLLAVELYSTSSLSILAPTLVGYGYLAFVFHASLLEDFHQETWGPDATMRQDWRFWMAYLFPFVSLVAALLGTTFLIYSALPSGTLKIDVIYAISALISLVFLLLLVPCFGTMVPAAIANKSFGFKAAFQRSRGYYWFVLWRILAGPILLGILWTALAYVLNLAELVPQIPETFSEVTAPNALWAITVQLKGTFVSALFASIFSLAYLNAEIGPVSLVSGKLQKA